ncbi:MAG: AAA domain-containing protein [Bacillota bacterium]
MVSQLETREKRLKQVFGYIKALNELRNPVVTNITEQIWSFWFDELPDHESIQLYTENDAPKVLKVARPELTPCPSPDEELKTWLKPGWDNINNEAEVIELKEIYNQEKDEFEIVKFYDDIKLFEAFVEWEEKRKKWQKEEMPARQAMDKYNKVFRLYSIIQKDSETVDLVLGDGLLNWPMTDGRLINHPILIQKIELTFDTNVPEFNFTLLDGSTEIYTALLRTIENLNVQDINKCMDELNEEQYQILNKESTDAYLRRLIISVSHKGEFVKHDKPQGKAEAPQMGRKPVLFLRKRNLGFTTMIDSILEDIPKNDSLPEFIDKVIGVDRVIQEEDNKSIIASDVNPNGEDEDVLLSKPANQEQLLVAKQLQKHGAVLVQGPPGTGKTHTIANLIGHLLAQGKSILVTSHTEKALSVLKEKVVPAVQPLCLNVFSSRSNRNEMETTLNEINERRSNIDTQLLSVEINKLEKQRKDLLLKLREKRNYLKNARNNEYRSIVIAGKEYTPTEAAVFVKANADKHGWIPGNVRLGEPLPLSPDEIIKLYKSNIELSQVDEQEAGVDLSCIDSLLSPKDFSQLNAEIRSLEKEDLDYKKYLWDNSTDLNNDKLKELRKTFAEIKKFIDVNNIWQLEMIESGIDAEDTGKKTIWENLIADIEKVYNYSIKSKELFIKYAPFIESRLINDDYLKELQGLIGHLENNGKVGALKLAFKKKWKEIIRNSKTNDMPPKALEEFQAIKAYMHLQIQRKLLSQRWDRQLGVLGMANTSEITEPIEEYAFRYVKDFKRNLLWYQDEWLHLISELKSCSFKWDYFDKEVKEEKCKYSKLLKIHSQIELLPEIISQHINRDLMRNYKVQVENLYKYVKKLNNVPVINDLLQSIHKLEPQKYEVAYRRLVELISVKEKVAERIRFG